MKAQAGICAEPNLHALYLMFNRTGDGAELAARLAKLPVLWDAVSADFPDAGFSGLVAVGADAWDDLYPVARPPQFRGFMTQSANGQQAPNTPFDLFVQLRAGIVLDERLKKDIAQALRTGLSARHVPNEIVQVAAIPRTLFFPNPPACLLTPFGMPHRCMARRRARHQQKR